MGDIGASLHTLINLTPKAYVLIFFPMALFYQYTVIDPYIFQKEIANILILGIIGAIAQPVLLGLFLKFVLGYYKLGLI